MTEASSLPETNVPSQPNHCSEAVNVKWPTGSIYTGNTVNGRWISIYVHEIIIVYYEYVYIYTE